MLCDFILINPHSDTPVYQQLYNSIKSNVEQGTIPAGEKLPSIRRLSGDLHVSRTTIETAYQQLCVEGYIESSPQRGYYVLQAAHKISAGEPAVSFPQQKLLPMPKADYDFRSGSIDTRGTDSVLWRKYVREVLTRPQVISSYGDPQGEPELRQALTRYSHSVRGVIASERQIVIGAGTQPLLYLLCGLLGQEGIRAGIETPGFRQAERVLSDCRVPFIRLPGDSEGVDMEALEQSKINVLFINPSSRLRTGTPIPMARRVRLLNWAEKTGGLIIEDDHNGELRYSARPIPALQGIGGGADVVYIGSFSKLLLPSVRMGYMVLPQRLIERYQARAGDYNQTASKIEQLALARYVREGRLEQHLRRLRKLYAAKSTMLLAELRGNFGDNARLTLQETALCVTVSFKTPCTGAELAEMAASGGVLVMPLEEKTKEGFGQVMLSFAGIPAESIAPAVQRLKESWHSL